MKKELDMFLFHVCLPPGPCEQPTNKGMSRAAWPALPEITPILAPDHCNISQNQYNSYMKPLAWFADTLDVVREFPAAARIEVGHELRRVQEGLNPSDWKPKTLRQDIELAARRFRQLENERKHK